MILLFRIFKTLSIPNRKNWWADFLIECSPPIMCHVTCQVSHVSCDVSCVKCQNFSSFSKWWSYSGEGLLSTRPTPSCYYPSVFNGKILHYRTCNKYIYIIGSILLSTLFKRFSVSLMNNSTPFKTSLLRRLQAQTLPDATPPIEKIHPFLKWP